MSARNGIVALACTVLVVLAISDGGALVLQSRGREGVAEAQACAQLMAASEPWTTLCRSYEDSLAIFTDPAREVYLALVEGKIAGFVILHMRGAFVGYIQSVGVLPRWRNQGTGRRLLRFAEERIFRETPNAFICDSSFNPRVWRLYERLGFVAVGELSDYIIPGHSEILCRKTIGPLVGFNGLPPLCSP